MSYPDATPRRQQTGTSCPSCGGAVKRVWLRYPTRELTEWEICTDCNARIKMLPYRRKHDRPPTSEEATR